MSGSVVAARSGGTPEPGAGLVRLGFAAGQVVQEIGYDDDVDDALRAAIEEVTNADLEDENFTGAADAVVLWWRSADGDLGDGLVDALTNLAERGFLLLLTPKPGRWGNVEAAEMNEAAAVAGVMLVGSAQLCADWSAHRVVATAGRR